MKYLQRFLDKELAESLRCVGFVCLYGPKGCGKSSLAKRYAKSIVDFGDESKRDDYLSSAKNNTLNLMKSGPTPRMFDDWQAWPELWDEAKFLSDNSEGFGHFILVGLSPYGRKGITDSAAGRVAALRMLPMSLFESNESNGAVSLRTLFEKPGDYAGSHSDLSYERLIFAICRGGWPGSISVSGDENQLSVAKNIYKSIYETEISRSDGTKRSPEVCRAILKAYAKAQCSSASQALLHNMARESADFSINTFRDYKKTLTDLMIIRDVMAWVPRTRASTAVKRGPKRNLVDPSLAAVALGLSPSNIQENPSELYSLFECLCLRDLDVYMYEGGSHWSLSYYRDRYGLEAGAVLTAKNGDYALVSFALNDLKVEQAAESLNKIEGLLRKKISPRKRKQKPYLMPKFKMVVTGTEYGYKRRDGVLVVPIGCLRD
jgi:predicted AAA+ superfamily ATPase